jgi:nucleotide sugar dehydrogenase
MNIGIIGYGVLGHAIEYALKDTYDILIIDPPKGMNGSLDDCDRYILCVPTPANKNGSCNTSLVEYYIKRISKPLLVKSTVDPNVLVKLYEECPFTYYPEFLREVSSDADFKTQEFALFAGSDTQEWITILINAGIQMDIIKRVSIEAASYAKYVINTFLATKVTFFNEIHRHIGNQQLYDEIIDCVNLDQRIGNSHMQVPGPDGNLGYGGMCFPKDVNALVHDRDLHLLQTVIDINNEIRGV